MLETECGEDENLLGVHDEEEIVVVADVSADDIVTPALEYGNILSNVAIKEGNMVDSTHVHLNGLSDENIDDETAVIVERLCEFYDYIELQVRFNLPYTDSYKSNRETAEISIAVKNMRMDNITGVMKLLCVSVYLVGKQVSIKLGV